MPVLVTAIPVLGYASMGCDGEVNGYVVFINQCNIPKTDPPFNKPDIRYSICLFSNCLSLAK